MPTIRESLIEATSDGDFAMVPDEYEACMENIFGDGDFVFIYLDYIIVYSTSKQTHLKLLHIVFMKLDKYDVTLNGKKCHILRRSDDFHGFTMNSAEIRL